MKRLPRTIGSIQSSLRNRTHVAGTHYTPLMLSRIQFVKSPSAAVLLLRPEYMQHTARTYQVQSTSWQRIYPILAPLLAPGWLSISLVCAFTTKLYFDVACLPHKRASMVCWAISHLSSGSLPRLVQHHQDSQLPSTIADILTLGNDCQWYAA